MPYLWHKYFCLAQVRLWYSILIVILKSLVTRLKILLFICFCKKKFSTFTKASFKKFRFADIILAVLTLYFEAYFSLRQIQSLLNRHMSVCVSHVSIYGCIAHFAPFYRTVSHFLPQKSDLLFDNDMLTKHILK